MQNSNVLTIDLTAIQTNYHLVSGMLSKGSRLMPIIKASAYGTDSLVIAKVLEQCGSTIFGVSLVSEGIALREGGITSPIFVISAPFYELEDVVHYNLEPAINSLADAEQLNQIALRERKVIRVHIHVNTGMQRLGMLPQEAILLASKMPQLKGLFFEGIFSHFVAAELAQHDAFSHSQIELFRQTLAGLKTLPPWIHMANSSAIFRFPLPFCNMVRVGLLLHGIFPFESQTNPLVPALSLRSRICGVNVCYQGETVGYRRTYSIQKSSARIAIVPVGYHDGIRQFFSKEGYVLIHKKQAPIVGRICMDFFMVDITEIPEAAIGDPVLIFGEGLPVTKVASWGELNVRELMTGLGTRIKREFIKPFKPGEESECKARKAVLTL